MQLERTANLNLYVTTQQRLRGLEKERRTGVIGVKSLKGLWGGEGDGLSQ